MREGEDPSQTSSTWMEEERLQEKQQYYISVATKLFAMCIHREPSTITIVTLSKSDILEQLASLREPLAEQERHSLEQKTAEIER